MWIPNPRFHRLWLTSFLTFSDAHKGLAITACIYDANPIWGIFICFSQWLDQPSLGGYHCQLIGTNSAKKSNWPSYLTMPKPRTNVGVSLLSSGCHEKGNLSDSCREKKSLKSCKTRCICLGIHHKIFVTNAVNLRSFHWI